MLPVSKNILYLSTKIQAKRKNGSLELLVQYFSQSTFTQNGIRNHRRNKRKLTERPETQNHPLKFYKFYLQLCIRSKAIPCGLTTKQYEMQY